MSLSNLKHMSNRLGQSPLRISSISSVIQEVLDRRLDMWDNCLHSCFVVPEGFSLPKAKLCTEKWKEHTQVKKPRTFMPNPLANTGKAIRVAGYLNAYSVSVSTATLKEEIN
ncbi:hypothetical protein Scep_022308 [Stephania cephalantha]|uniref:Uncharacterized protein n=1 Tax=Stephania cephalantha TaxID=152367 RepID=A0AAP0I2K3_9MAGN